MISTQAATLVILGMLGLVANHVFACIWYYLGADDFSEECSTADVPACVEINQCVGCTR